MKNVYVHAGVVKRHIGKIVRASLDRKTRTTHLDHSEVPRSSLRARGPSGPAARGEGRPFIPPAELGGILEYFDKSPG